MNLCTKVRSHVIEVILAAALATSGLPAFAAETHQFDIPAEAAPAAIRDFATQANVQILTAGDNVKDKQLHAVSGVLSTDQGLHVLLADSGLSPQYVGDHSIALVSDAGKDRRAQNNLPAPRGDAGTPIRLAQAASQKNGPSVDDSGATKKKSTTESAPADSNQDIPEILVTGSHILNVDLKRSIDDAQAYYVFTQESIEQAGSQNLGDFLRERLTMNASFTTGAQSAGPGGNLSQINLRGLGAGRTLVLVDGRRMAGAGAGGGGGGAATTQPDINSIPLSAIERIEVLPNSASAIYGADAEGGVVNIILKRNYEGGSIGVSYDDTFSGSSPQRQVNANLGLTFEGGRSHLLLAGSITDNDALHSRDRISAWDQAIATMRQTSPVLIYSPTRPFLGGTTNIVSADGSNLTLRNGTPLGSSQTFIPYGFGPNSDPAALVANAGQWNFNPAATNQPATFGGLNSSLGQDVQQKSFLATLSRDMTDTLNVFVQFSINQNDSSYDLGAIPVSAYLVPASAPTNPFLQDVYIRAPLNAPGALGRNYSTSITEQIAEGFTWKLPHDWSVGGDYTWSKHRESGQYWDSSGDDDAISAAYASGALNPFVDTVANPPGIDPYIGPAAYGIDSTLNDLGLRVAGPLWKLPAGPIFLTLGVEHRQEGLHNGFSSNSYPNAPADSFVIQYEGQRQTVNSLYGETKIPLISPENGVPGVRLLDVQLAARAEDYKLYARPNSEFLTGPSYYLDTNIPIVTNISKKTSVNPTFGIRYKPIDDVLLRGSYSRGFLPPTFGQIAANPQVTVGTIIDPRRGDSSYDVPGANLGNPNLAPEKSRSLTAGIVYEPSEVQGLRAAIDWYRIDQTDTILSINEQDTVSNEAYYPGLVTRGPNLPGDPAGFAGPITFVNSPSVNAAKAVTQGLDLALDYRSAASIAGIFDLHVGATVVREFKQQAALNAPYLDLLNDPFAGGPLSNKINGTIAWEYRHFIASWATTYYGSYLQYGPPATSTAFIAAQGGAHIPGQIYHDVYASYSFSKDTFGSSSVGRIADGVKLQAGIKNVFNAVPPFDALNSSVLYTSPLGDIRLRHFWLAVRKDF